MRELAEQFHTRFTGLARAHGETRLTGKVRASDGKKEAHSKVVREPATIELWEEHLSGTLGVGIVPIRDDATVRFGAIDIDVYDGLDLVKLADTIARIQLPLIVCRSKSGGAQCYVFTNEDVPAELVRGKLMEWAISLGHSGVEVFPKQTRLAGTNDWGNYINMPYFAAEATERYAVHAGAQLDAAQFLATADMMAVDAATLRSIEVPQDVNFKEILMGAPPCLQSLAQSGFGEGMRNNGLFNVGVYLRKRFGDDDWFAKLDEYNQQFMTPPLGHREVAAIEKSLKRKTYQYKCNDMPLAPVCNRQICLTRKFGVGGEDGDPGVAFGTLSKLDADPPLWIWDVDGARIELTTAELKDQMRFHSKCIEVLNKWPVPVKPQKWAELIRDKLQSVEVIEAPPEATPEGQMWAHLEQYCTGRPAARKRDELLQHKPWSPKQSELGGDAGRTYFSANHFKTYLAQQRILVEPRQLWNWLRKRGAEHHFFNIKGRGLNCWSIPSFSQQTEDLTVPTLGESPDEDM